MRPCMQRMAHTARLQCQHIFQWCNSHVSVSPLPYLNSIHPRVTACPLAYLNYQGSETALGECPSVQDFLGKDLSNGAKLAIEDLISIHAELNYMYADVMVACGRLWPSGPVSRFWYTLAIAIHPPFKHTLYGTRLPPFPATPRY